MPRLELSRREWEAVAYELIGTSLTDVPAGLPERIDALLADAPLDWLEQRFVLELDDPSAAVVRMVHATLTGLDPSTGQRAASLTEAEQILHDYQQRNDRA
jgi:hypothetical protein